MKGFSIPSRGLGLATLLLATLLVAHARPASPGDGVVAIRTADPGCADDSGDIYVDCGNGTVTDNRTGLVWLKRADCMGFRHDFPAGAGLETTFPIAREFVMALNHSHAMYCDLTDNSLPGDWRLPTIDEWAAMIADAVALGCGGVFGPMITNDRGNSCWQEGPGNSFTGVRSDFYWSASHLPSAPGLVSIVNLDDGTTNLFRMRNGMDLVWPVRGGQ